MGGFFGAVSNRDVVLDLFFGVDYHSHLGTRRAGMVLLDREDGSRTRRFALGSRKILSRFTV